MSGPQLDYAGPRTPKCTPKPSPWLVAGAAVAVAFFVTNVLRTPSMGSRGERAKRAKVAAAATDLSQLDYALNLFRQDTGRVPTDAEGLNALVVRPVPAEPWQGPYLKRGVPNDPWGNAYVYRAAKPTGGKAVTLLSRGADGEQGTSDDVVNR